MLYCLDDGNALLEGPARTSGGDEPATAMFGIPPLSGSGSEPEARATGVRGGEDPTRQHINTTDPTAILRRGAEAKPHKSVGHASEKQSFSANRAAKPLIGAAVAVAILMGGFFGYRYFKSSSGGQISSIAVLPFENRSGNADSDYLSDGIAESLIYRLTQLPNLKVSPTSSVIRYRGKDADIAQVAKELEVDAVMSGRLVQRGDNLTLSVELIGPPVAGLKYR